MVRPFTTSIPKVTNEPCPLVLLNPRVDVLGDVFSNVFSDALSSGFDRHQLSSTETVTRCSLAPKLPFRLKSRRCRPIILLGKCLKVTPRANIRVQNTQAVKVQPSTLLTLWNRHDALVTRLQHAPVKIINPQEILRLCR